MKMKNFALICLALSLYHLPLNAQFPTRAQIFDFEVGDRFQYQELTYSGSSPPEYLTRTIVNKTISSGGDSITYDYGWERIRLNISTFQWNIVTTGSGSVMYDSLSAMISGDTVLNDISMNNLLSVWRDASYGGPLSAHNILYKHAVGVGEYYYHHHAPGDGIDEMRYLIYYKKDTVEWGSQFIVDVQDPLIADFIIYPNPVAEQVIVNWPQELKAGAGRYEILGMDGKSFGAGELSPGENSISTERLARGIYILNLQTELGTQIQKISKI